MQKIKIYLETTIFNRVLEDEREYSAESKMLFEKIFAGEFDGYTSAVVMDELDKALEPKRSLMLNLIAKDNIFLIEIEDEMIQLAEKYIEMGVIPKRFMLDALHIAIASVAGMDIIVSLNFHHINKMKTKTITSTVNKMLGYSCPEICTPMEVIYDD